MTYVIVDAPRTEARNVSPTVVATTSLDRLHPLPRPQRRHLEQAGAQRPPSGSTTSTPTTSSREWVEPLSELSGQAGRTSTRCSTTTARSTMPGPPALDGSTEDGATVAQAPVNAQMLRGLLERDGLPVTPAPAAAT